MAKLAIIVGTRPEAIKLAPVVLQCRETLDVEVICTGQHPIVPMTLEYFGIKPDIRLNYLPDSSLNAGIAQCLPQLEGVLKMRAPDMVVVQGDTLSALAGTIAAFNLKIPVAHVEAGLRTRTEFPFPEEAYRKAIAAFATLHFAPTQRALEHLREEKIEGNRIRMVGNTVIDAVKLIASAHPPILYNPKNVLVTLHRREHQERLSSILNTIYTATQHNHAYLTVVMHPNPALQEIATETLEGKSGVVLLQPMEYPNFVREMQQSYLIVTDSGGIQEEAAALHKPVIVARQTTERIEGVKAGVAVVGGVDPDTLYDKIDLLFRDQARYQKMCQAENPYGDGKASYRIAFQIYEFLLTHGKRSG